MKHKLQGLYVITDEKLINRTAFEKTVEQTLRHGANLVQLREKIRPKNETVEIGKKLLKITRKYGVPLICNDSPEIANEIDADGVHLGKNDPEVKYARNILGKKKIIGVSCYNDLRRGMSALNEGADYLAFGTPYYTPTKPERKPTQLKTLFEAGKIFGEIPIFAIGGIDINNIGEILETGVDGVAVITSVFGQDDPGTATAELVKRIINYRI